MKWYAVVRDSNDLWDYGSHDLEEAKEMLKSQGFGTIAVIDNDLCEDTITVNGVPPYDPFDSRKIKTVCDTLNVADIEIFYSRNGKPNIHSDNLESLDIGIDDICWHGNVLTSEPMTESEYNKTVLANSCISADFETWYGDKNAQVMVVLIG